MLFRHSYKLLFRSVHVFDSTQSSDSCFGYFRNHSADTAKCETPFHGSVLGLQALCHFVRYFEFNFFLDLVEAPTFFSTGVVSAKVLLQVVSVATLTAISYFHFVHFLSCSTFMCFLGYSCHNTNARHHDRSSGRQ